VMTHVSDAYLELVGGSKAELAKVYATGSPPELSALIGYEYRGFNHPRATALLGIRKFIKAFYLDRAGQPFGCNTPTVQNGLSEEWIAKPSPEQPKRYAFFRVYAPDGEAADTELRGAALLDYGQGGNKAFDPAGMLRDYVVRVRPGSDDLLLGKAYFVIGGTRLSHTYFLIERYRKLADSDPLTER
jgi:hypothetical protein